MKRFVVAAVLLAGCSSLVSDPCQQGYQLNRGQCLASSVAPPDGGSDVPGGDAGVAPDAPAPPVCKADTTSDPFNCGACGIVCPSGICAMSACVGGIAGHVVGIGHDFVRFDQAMTKVLGNSVALARATDIGVARWHGSVTAPSDSGTVEAIGEGLAGTSRTWHDVAVPETPSFEGIDVLLVEAQTGDGDGAAASIAPWAPAIGSFLSAGGVVVVLEGRNGVSYRLASAAGLYDASAPVDASNTIATIVAPADATTQNVISPYMARETSSAYPTADGATITADAGVVVFHLTR